MITRKSCTGLDALAGGSLIPADIERVLVRSASGLLITNGEKQLADDFCEDFFASRGCPVISHAAFAIVVRFEAGLPITGHELEAVLYEIYAGPYGEYFPRFPREMEFA